MLKLFYLSILLQTLDTFGWDPKHLGAQLGATMVLHTWGSNLSYHPHIHCIVPGGGITLRNRWKSIKANGKYLFPVKALSKVFRGKLIDALQSFCDDQGLDNINALKQLRHTKGWVVYAKRPFGDGEGVIRYLARYTHNTAISHHRIIDQDDQHVRFRYKDYRHANQNKVMTLDSFEFVRRFMMHILPHGFTRIRHYGILSSQWKHRLFRINKSVDKQDWKTVWEIKGLQVDRCPICKKGSLIHVREIPPLRGPPRINYITKTPSDDLAS